MINSSNPSGAHTPSFLSLREIGRQLAIPPSSVVYYKDRFFSYIPKHGQGRRARYPQDALTVFKEIRTMFDNRWSADQIEQELSRKFGVYSREEGGEECSLPVAGIPGRDVPAQGGAAEWAGVLSAMSALLENQGSVRADMDVLREEVAGLRRERDAMQDAYEAKVQALEQELVVLRKERDETLRRILDRMGHDEDTQGSGETPGEEFLSLPLVIRSRSGEYLGVSGKNTHFCLRDFVGLMRRRGGLDTVRMTWEPSGKGWALHVDAPDRDAVGRDSSGRDSDSRREHVLELARTVTPSGNAVIQLTRLAVDGDTVPDPFLMVLFRKIKEEFE